MKRAALYCRVSTVDQHPETQLPNLQQFAAQRGLQIVQGVRGSRILRGESAKTGTRPDDGGRPPS
jgi:DNA invertase Pin-like site-specific DNA recombinase